MSKSSIAAAPASEASFAATVAAGLIALAVAMGIGRFAFTPMLPLMIRSGSADVAAGGWLAAANYAGYLAGALGAARIPLPPQKTTLLSLAAIVVSTAAMGWTHAVPAWALLRFVAGVASAWALVSTSVWCLEGLARFGRPSGAGMLYAGVGAGIALAGLYCWRAGAAEIVPESLWRQLGGLALAGLLAVAWLMAGAPARAAAARSPAIRAGDALHAGGEVRVGDAVRASTAAACVPWGLVICYGALGFGYILPATFLPVMAREVVDDPAVFGAAWPVFGTAAALSTVLAGMLLAGVPRRRLMAGSHALMAAGCVLPLLHLSAATVLAAALLVGGTFMVATMAGMQEAKALAGADPTRALGRMTAAFAIGQIAGPLLSSGWSRATHGEGGLEAALAVGALVLLASAAWLLRGGKG